jgi:hypothetical protein
MPREIIGRDMPTQLATYLAPGEDWQYNTVVKIPETADGTKFG